MLPRIAAKSLRFVRYTQNTRPIPPPKPFFVHNEWTKLEGHNVKKPLANISHFNNLDLIKPIDYRVAREKGLRRLGCLALKVGMMAYFDGQGIRYPVTLLLIDDCRVMGYTEVERKNSLNLIRVTMGIAGKKPWRLPAHTQTILNSLDLPSKRDIEYFNCSPECILPVGWSMNAGHFVPGQRVDVKAKTQGRGTQGVMRRWGFKGLPATHGVSLKHRSGGSIGSSGHSRVLKGKKMAGRMGNELKVVYNMQVMQVDVQNNYLLVLGNVPGNRGAPVWIRDSLSHPTEVPFPTFLPGDQESAQVPAAASV